jgi:hypothetical protein
VACPQPLDGRLALMGRGRLADAVLRVGCRHHRHAARGADPFLARRRTGYCLAAEYQNALGHQAVLPWTLALAAARHLAPHQSERRAPLGRGLAARLAAEPASAAAALAADLLVPLALLLVPLALLLA